jgi:hypothetical protein
MPIGDPLYQLNDLAARVKVLENAARAIAPQTASAAPHTVLTSATSRGQVTPNANADLASRITTALQAGLTGIESVVEVLTVPFPIVNFGGGTTQLLHATNYIRPDPVAGDVYRVTAFGRIDNDSGVAATIEFFFNISAGTNLFIGPVLMGNGETRWYWIDLKATVTSAGTAGNVNVTTRFSASNDARAVGFNPVAVGLDYLSGFAQAYNLVAPAPQLVVVSTVTSAAITVSLKVYIIERLGAKSFSQV